MFMLRHYYVLFLLTIVSGEEYNLFGDAGQAYSMEIYLGTPKQKLNVIVDTGSTTLAVASYSRQDSDKYFQVENSTNLIDSGKEVQAKYSQGMWVGRLVSDYVEFPSLPQVPQVRSDFAVITNSQKFFMNGSGWQGLLGLAYLPVGAWGNKIVVGSWLDSLECNIGKSVSFELKLCGPQSPTNATHYGKFSMIVDNEKCKDKPRFYTPILHKRWYEVGVIGVNVVEMEVSSTNSINKTKTIYRAPYSPLDLDDCQMLNAEKSIVDSGTTNIRLPDEIFRKVVNEIRKQAQAGNILILDEFWYHGEAACWPESQQWTLPYLEIYLLHADDDRSYFTLRVPPQHVMLSFFKIPLLRSLGIFQNYMRVVSTHDNSEGTVSQYCYKLGIEAGGKDTVLGYTAMEGFEVLFNRSGGWIGWDISDCGPCARLEGPFYVRRSLLLDCELTKSDLEVAVSIKAAQWALLAVSIIAGAVLLYLLAPCLKFIYFKPRPNASRLSMSGEALVDQELN
ncbi:unnamed protein product [Diatraea saccharalis]|uniref:Peptidase A1 domain-containing protein n=1 Tax=Diatraea saccharalis TaxID=40085 RepID=A0A9N9WBA8_9NEOP|nr:unnamed protein product [Diatraea saccharalis]